VVAPTGSGKSLIFERAAKKPDTRVLLISPLIALARQHAVNLQKQNLNVYLRSGGGLPGFEKSPPRHGNHPGVLIASPESFENHNSISLLKEWNPTLIAVDECHCLWEWGEDFRPAFLKIPHILHELQINRSLWLTATLPYEARQELISSLAKPETNTPIIEIGEFSLPESLSINIEQVSWHARIEALLGHVKKSQPTGLIFVSTRSAAERISRLLGAAGYRAIAYHAGLGQEERRAIETGIPSSRFDVVVATSAFGMGMHFPELRWVLLWQAPGSLLSLAQTIGRVGRAGVQAQATVFWDNEDFHCLEWMAIGSPRRTRALQQTFEYFTSSGCYHSKLVNYFNKEAREHQTTKTNNIDKKLFGDLSI
jgi:ATP-dependent DNA helicase RecQ